MAGKWHRDYARYVAATGRALFPTKQVRAYAEGYNASRAGALQSTNPHPGWQSTDPNSDFISWLSGWSDYPGYPPTHVG